MKQLDVNIKAHDAKLEGFLNIPDNATGIIVFVHGSGSSRLSPRNQAIAEEFNEFGMATLLFDLLTKEEEERDLLSREYRFNIPMLTKRVVAALDWLSQFKETTKMVIGLIGSSTGAAAALAAAAIRPELVKAVVSRGGRPDLAASSLHHVIAPTLLIVGAKDDVVIELNKSALNELPGEKKLELVPDATHLFEEPGTLNQASHLARGWFLSHFGK